MISVNGIDIKPTIFPDGTSQVWHLPEGVLDYIRECESLKSHATIRWDFKNEGELIQVCQLANYLSVKYPFLRKLLFVPYLPYGRQDKEISNDATFALSTFASIVNKFFDCISTIDAHSNRLSTLHAVHPNHYPGFINKFPKKQIELAIRETRVDFACYPDKSAMERYSKHIDLPYVFMDKVRDQATGQITGLRFNTDAGCNYDITDRRILIIDDICDGGRTFIECAKLLYMHRAKVVHLYVSHGIFSKGLTPLEDAGIQEIYTKDGLQSCPF